MSVTPGYRPPNNRSGRVIRAVIEEHAVDIDAFFGVRKTADLVEARRDAAHRLAAMGYAATTIARYLRRDHSTILNYFPNGYMVRKSRYFSGRMLEHLAPDARQTVIEIAKAEAIKPELLMAGWVSERAAFELDAKRRAA